MTAKKAENIVTSTVVVDGMPIAQQARAMVDAIIAPQLATVDGELWGTVCTKNLDDKYAPRAQFIDMRQPGALDAFTNAVMANPNPASITSWTTVNLFSHRPEKGRGKAADVANIGVLVLDLDTRRDDIEPGQLTGHAENLDELPTEAQAWKAIAKLTEVLGQPTAVVRSSSEGLQSFWATEGIVPTDSDILIRYKALCEQVGTDMGVKLDLTRCGDAASLMRFPGNNRVKDGYPHDPDWTGFDADGAKVKRATGGRMQPETSTLLRLNPASRVSAEQLDAVLPALSSIASARDLRPTKKGKKASPSEDRRSYVEKDIDRLPVARLAEVLFPLQLFAGNADDACRHEWTGATTPPSTEQVWDETMQAWLLFVNGNTPAHDLGKSTESCFTTSTLLRFALGDWSDKPSGALYRKVLEVVKGFTLDELLNFATSHLSKLDSRRVDWQARNFNALSEALREVAASDAQSECERLHEALTKPQGQEFIIGDRYKLVVGGANCGTYVNTSSSDDGYDKWEQLSAGVIVRTAYRKVVQPIGGVEEDGVFSVVVVGPNGVWRSSEVPLTKSTDIKYLLSKAMVGAGVPTRANETDMLNAILLAGSAGVRNDVSVGVPGWVELDDGWRFVGQRSSVTPTAVDPEVRRRSNAHPGGFSDLMTQEEAEQVFIMFDELFDCWGQKNADLSTMLGIIGTIFASPIPATHQHVAYVYGKHGLGKTLLGMTGACFTYAPSEDLVAALDVTKQTSLAPFMQTATAMQNGWLWIDDLKYDQSVSEQLNRERITYVAEVVRMAYNRKGKALGGAGGEVRETAVGAQHISGLVTAEIPVEDPATIERGLIPREIRAGDISLTKVQCKDSNGEPMVMPSGEPVMDIPLMAWMRRWRWLAGKVFTSYVAWLSARVQADGGTEMLSEEFNDLVANIFPLPSSDRAAMSVSYAAAGLEMGQRFMHEVYGEPFLEDPEEMRRDLAGLIDINREMSAERDHGTRILNAVRAVTGNRGFGLTTLSHMSCADDGITAAMGWRRSASGDWMDVTDPIGTVSNRGDDEGKWVLLTVEDARKAVKESGGVMGKEQTATALADLMAKHTLDRDDLPEDIIEHYRSAIEQGKAPKLKRLPMFKDGQGKTQPMRGYLLPAELVGIYQAGANVG
ncbi:hypothetical protein [Luteococcus peritonei]|uniref:DUF927 domain-containing protein n=1 Tax=Luteococcus peritonei TaxID=88874 RepID=A0ABW4RXG6_9ACTN